MEQQSEIESILSLQKHRTRVKNADRSKAMRDPCVEKVLNDFLFRPALEIRKRPSHSFRSQLVEVGFLLTRTEIKARDRQNLDLCAESIEFLHLGSLIVDDIQDGSEVRRGGAALHRTLGPAHAMGVGNWLYFYALRLLAKLDLTAPQLTALYASYLETVELAHYGQVMDLCIKIDRVPYSQIETLSHECMRYKTGSIVMLALVLGAMVGGAAEQKIKAVEQVGYALGIYLQRMNDLGNCVGNFDPEKKWEDLINWKPSYIWGFAAREYGSAAVQQLMQAVRALPDERPWQDWLTKRKLFDDAKAMAENDFDGALQEFCEATAMSRQDLRLLAQLKERIQKAYG